MGAIRGALRQRSLRLLLGAALISLTGDWVLRIGLAYYIYVLTGSTLASALMLLASFVPQIVLSSLAGVFVDRWDSRRTMILANLLLAAGLLPLLAVHRADQVWIVYGVTAVESCVQQFFVPAQQSLLPALVDDASLVTANALNGQANDVSRLAGSAAGGILAAVGGIVALACTDIVSFLLAAVLISRITVRRQPGSAAAVRRSLSARLVQLRAEWTDGLRVSWRQRTLRVVLMFLAVTCVGEGIMSTLFAPFVRSVLHGSGPDFGVIVSAQAIGGIAGGLIAASLGSRARASWLFGWGAVAFGAIDLVMFLYPLAWVTVWPAVVCMIVVGLPGALMLAGALTMVQRAVADSHRGRVFGAFGAVEGAAVVAGTVAAGLLGQAVGIIGVLAAQGAGYLIAGLAVVVALRGHATADQPVPSLATALGPRRCPSQSRPARRADRLPPEATKLYGHFSTGGGALSTQDRFDIEREREQTYITELYARLDELRERATHRLAGVLRQAGGTPAARTEREGLAVMYRQQLGQLDAAENGLCFGRLEFNDGVRSYIGRLGMHADNEDYDQLLMDWRADAARPFYLATAASPGVVRVRRHIKTRGRTVQRLDDEVLDLAVADPSRHEGLTGESALLAALNASRTGRMRDIVETIQAEQDHIIRSGLPGVLVVQGGPGTGKTAVALHRAAYLLYTYRRQLEKRGVLVIGPNATFLRYIGQVLPSLGETSVLLATIGDLMPGIEATGTEPAEVARIKGRPAMAKMVAAAVRDRQRVPDEGLEVGFDRDIYRLTRQSLSRARERARRSRRPHNQARQVFTREVLDELARVVAGRLGADPLGGGNLMGRDDIDELRAELRDDPGVRAAIGRLWPVLTPQQLIGDLLASRRLLATAAPSLTASERELLRRPAGSAWTPADVPLLDEAAELLGEDNRTATALARRRREEEESYAQGVLEIIGRDEEDDPEILMGADMLDAVRLAARFDSDVHMTAAERAAADRTWAYGHVIVDEAQELSPMAWRMLMRRCPARSMTIVGDVAQTGDMAGSDSWSDALGPFVGDRWRLAPLTVNYRTPAEIMTVAADVLAEIDRTARPPRSVRESGVAPWRLGVADPAVFAPSVVQAAVALAAQTGAGTMAVISPAGRLAELGAAVAAALPDVGIGDPGLAEGGSGNGGRAGPAGETDLERPVVVLTVRQAKGLEFDSVLVVDPGMILAESKRGLGDLYVALTRATRRAGVVYTGDLPPVLGRLAEVASVAEVAAIATEQGATARAEVA